MTENTQAVAETTEAPVTPAAEAPSAQENHLAFLEEYENSTKAPEPAKLELAVTDPTILALKSKVEAMELRDATERNERDLSKTMKDIRGDLDVPEWFTKGWLSTKAAESKAIEKIWAERDSNPGAVKKMVEGMKKQFAQEAGKLLGPKVDAAATEDTAAVAAAVRGSSTRVPNEAPPKFGSMSNAQYRQYVKENHGYDPGV